MRHLSTIVAIAGAVTILQASPIAAAAPDCVDTGPTTTQCETAGHVQIITSPPAMDPPFGGYPFVGYAIGFPW